MVRRDDGSGLLCGGVLKRAHYRAEILDEPPIKGFSCLRVVGGGQLVTAVTFWGSMAIPSAEIT